MPSTIQLLDHGALTFEDAKAKDFNVIQSHNNNLLARKLCGELWNCQDAIKAITMEQLGLGYDTKCCVAPPQEWIRGRFNICIPIQVNSCHYGDKIIMRCPMPNALPESAYPGAVDEKLRSETGAYAWMQEHCPDIRIPRLYGFSISGRHFTHESSSPWYIRLPRSISRSISRYFRSLLELSTLSRYVPANISMQLPTQYMLLEHIGQPKGQVLSDSWDIHRNDPSRRDRLFHGLARVIVSLSRIPQPRIGSFQFHDDCTVTLTNRPAFAATTILESRGAQRSIQSGETYTCTEPFVSDMVTLHDNYFYSNESAADDEADCRGQMGIRTMLRAISHNFITREYRNGPFRLQLTDLHQSNIFVDDDWNVTCLIDLEWLCALPPDAILAPYWLSGCGIADLVDEGESQNWTEYDRIRQEFMHVLSEEQAISNLSWPLSTTMEDTWQSMGVWFWLCLSSVDAAYYLMADHICPQFSASLSPKVEESFSKFWKHDAESIVVKKVSEYNRYEQDLRLLFE